MRKILSPLVNRQYGFLHFFDRLQAMWYVFAPSGQRSFPSWFKGLWVELLPGFGFFAKQIARSRCASVSARVRVVQAAGAMLENLTDEKLMVQLQKGQLRAFELLLQRHRRGVYNFVYRFVGNRHLAEDFVQDVFLKLFAARSGFEKRSRFTTWLYTIARNRCIDHLRKKQRRNCTSLDQPVNPGAESEVTLMERIGGNQPGPDQQAHSQRLREHILQAIAALSEEQREVFLMREEAGLPFDQIARMVNAPLNTVKSRMRYALQNLRANLEALGVEP